MVVEEVLKTAIVKMGPEKLMESLGLMRGAEK
jgi:hypothetical protein